MRVAILGTRGIPANYGGFETFAEELGARLSARGHHVIVYGRQGWVPKGIRNWRGVEIRTVPTLRTKHLDTVISTGIAAMDLASKHDVDAVLLCNAANAPWIRLLQTAGIPVAVNVDGIERKRRKWGSLGKAWYATCERLVANSANRIVADAEVIRKYWQTTYRVGTAVIPYGSELPHPQNLNQLQQLGLEPGSYALYVSRFEPENNPDRVAAQWSAVKPPMPLVMLGSARYDKKLQRKVESLAGPNVILPGAIYGEGYRQLLFNCRLYIHATEVGGTHPALVEAMGAGRPIAYLATPENIEVVGSAGIPFSFDPTTNTPGLAEAASQLLTNQQLAEQLASQAAQRARQLYSWEKVTDLYEKLLEGMC